VSGKYTLYKLAAPLLAAAIHTGCGQPASDPIKSLQDSSLVYTTHEGQVGGRKKLQLADSSTVILNAGSRLLVPENFPQGGRELVLDGEAFFDAAPSEKHPLVVKTEILTVTALGTTFKVRCFAAQPGATAYLLNGKVKVTKSYHSATDNQPEILERGNMVLANKEIDLMEKETYEPAELEAWLQEDLRFQNTPFATVIRKLEDWYAVSITVDGNTSNVPPVTGSFPGHTLQQVLDILRKPAGYSYKIRKNEVTLKFAD
jgi:ferric-dicitrate binding protein FerR (iron transport regulator)